MKTITKNILLVVTMILALLHVSVSIFLSTSSINQFSQIINSSIIFIISAMFALYYFKYKKLNLSFTIINMFLILFLSINILSSTNLISLPTKQTLGDLSGKNISDVMDFADKNKIELDIIYENSESIKAYEIISQDISFDTLLKDVKKIKLTVSEGKDLNKLIIVPNMMGWDTEKVTKYVLENNLVNADVEFVNSTEKENTVIAQSKNGEMKRNDSLKLTFAKNKDFVFTEIAMLDFKDKTLFEATIWAKQNGIELVKEFAFNDEKTSKVKKGNILSQNIASGENITTPSITLTISKGNKITLPNLSKMSIEDIATYVTKNKLKVSFTDRYDNVAPLGNIISTNYKEGDIIEEGTLIEVLSSKGQLKMEKFNNIEEFRAWAAKYSIPTAELFQSNNEVPEGEIIKFSHAENAVLKIGETVTIYVSKGAPVTIPTLNGKSKSTAISELSKLGLKYSISYSSSFSNKAKDIVLSQSIAAGTNVEKGTSVNLVLSKGAGITVPTLVRKDKNAINSTCSSLGLRVTFVTGGYSSVPAGCAVSQSVAAGTKVNSGTVIKVTLSKGPAQSKSVYIQPNWVAVGNAQATANNITKALKAIYPDLTVNISYVTTNEPNKTGIVASSPNITITQGSSVTIKIYK